MNPFCLKKRIATLAWKSDQSHKASSKKEPALIK